MHSSPRTQRRTALWDSFMPIRDVAPANLLEVRRAQAEQTVLLHAAPDAVTGACRYCGSSWVCTVALRAAFILGVVR